MESSSRPSLFQQFSQNPSSGPWFGNQKNSDGEYASYILSSTCVAVVFTKVNHSLEGWVVSETLLIGETQPNLHLSAPGRGIEFSILKSEEFFFGWNFAQVILSILKVMAVTIPARPKHPATPASCSGSSTDWTSPLAFTNSSLLKRRDGVFNLIHT